MPVGFRAYKNFERPDAELVKQFKNIPSSNISDAMRRMYSIFKGIRPFNKLPLLGVALTVKLPVGDNLAAQAALDYAQPGDIIVLDGAGYSDRALLGGMMLEYAKIKKIGGFVVDGAIRDLDEVKSSGIPVFAKSVTTLGPYREGPGEINVPVVCGGQVIMPGDILVGDSDGIVVIPKDFAIEVLEGAKLHLAKELEETVRMRTGKYTSEEHIKTFTGKFVNLGGTVIE